MTWGVDHADIEAADWDFGAVVEAAVDALLRDLDLAAADEHGSAGGGSNGVVRHPVIRMPVRCDDSLDTAFGGDRLEQRRLSSGMSTSTAAPAATSRTTYALLP